MCCLRLNIFILIIGYVASIAQFLLFEDIRDLVISQLDLTTVVMMLGNTCKVLSTALRKNIFLCHRLKDLHQSVVNWLWNRLAFYAHKVRFITEFPIGKDEFQVYLVGRYGQQVEVLWEGRVKNGLFQLIASPGSHTYPVFELNFTPERVKGGGGVFGSQAYLARNTSLERPPSVGIIVAGRYHKETDVLQHFEEVLVETVLKHEQSLDGYDSDDLEDYYNVPWHDHSVNYYDDDCGQRTMTQSRDNDGGEMDYDSVSENAGDEVTGD